jgi:hypothetical protein
MNKHNQYLSYREKIVRKEDHLPKLKSVKVMARQTDTHCAIVDPHCHFSSELDCILLHFLWENLNTQFFSTCEIFYLVIHFILFSFK